MNEAEKVEKLKEASLEIFKLRENFEAYQKKIDEITDKVHRFKLEHTIDPGELGFRLTIPVSGKKLSDISSDEFRRSVEDYFKLKERDYYFQLVELGSFPPQYKLGFGALLVFDSLPKEVKDCAESLSKGKVPSAGQSMQKMWNQIIQALTIPSDPKAGQWLKISVSAISSSTSLDRAFEYAEESLDILRMAISSARFHLPMHAIALDKDQSKAFPVAKGVEFSKYSYDPRHQNLIDGLNTICVKPSSDLEKRIKTALHFFRIADNNAPDYHKLFFYVAAIENLILGADDRDVLRWKFSEKGAVLLSDKLRERLAQAAELKAMYDSRSKIAHGGEADYDFLLTTSSRYCLRKTIIRLMTLINKNNLKTVARKNGKPNQSLDEYLDNIIYSG
jgi:hypothetical protein